MFDLFAMLLSSIASFLFPIFASYKALKTSDPAQLAPWLMYWVVFSCCLLAESWTCFILTWIPFYGYARLLFLIYLILPQMQGARVIYVETVHPFLEENEASIDDFIGSAHDRLKAAGITSLRQVVEYLKTNLLGLSTTEQAPAAEPAASPSYTQSLLARFSMPATRWSAAAYTGSDFYNILANVMSPAASTTVRSSVNTGIDSPPESSFLIPPTLRDPTEKMSFITAQRERLNIVLSALDRQALEIQRSESSTPRGPRASPEPEAGAAAQAAADATDDAASGQRPPSGLSMWSALSKSRSETDFENLEAESGTEDNDTVRRRNVSSGASGSWVPWGWRAGVTLEE